MLVIFVFVYARVCMPLLMADTGGSVVWTAINHAVLRGKTRILLNLVPKSVRVIGRASRQKPTRMRRFEVRVLCFDVSVGYPL